MKSPRVTIGEGKSEDKEYRSDDRVDEAEDEGRHEGRAEASHRYPREEIGGNEDSRGSYQPIYQYAHRVPS